VIAEYDGSDTLLRKFVYGPGIDEPICMIAVSGGETKYYYHFDGLGSVVALSDSSSVVVERYGYDVFGEPNTVSTIDNPYYFTGRRLDDETGLYYYRARYYDYANGRFLQTDSVGYSSDLNLYRYCKNNPIMFVDPHGLDYSMTPGAYDWVSSYQEMANERRAKQLAEHMNDADHYKKFIVYSINKTREDIITERTVNPRWYPGTINRGPEREHQYIKDPAYPNRVIDMVHFLSVGPRSRAHWYGIELYQTFHSNPDTRASAWHAQDMYSNKLGRDFHNRYKKLYGRYPFAVLLNDYFVRRERECK
jgi:RHS repeat-associated protein